MKALALISGGLDSILAAKLIQEQSIEIIPVNFRIPFCKRPVQYLNGVGKFLGEPVRLIDICADFVTLLENPGHGFGSNMNPCIDCKILMLRRAKQIMDKEEAAFIITGEVLAQRPMSQHRRALDIIEQESGLSGLLLRPLSARLLPQSLPEKEGWVRRELLLDFSGRQRRPQIDLAEKLKLRDYAQPSGGCLLTDPEFTGRLKETIEHNELSLDNIELLKWGRHFRISGQARLVVGRNQRENDLIALLAKEGDYLFMPDADIAGPTALGKGMFNPELIKLCAQITCRYCDIKDKKLSINYKLIPQEEKKISVLAADEKLLELYRI